ncbi:hypothetical protein L3Q67_25720 [Saccharothrix sp. AJ9571]|nr:hypothetical protein L3Q67_25720 [Saccharothrix sp. AJ9571]
MVNPDPPDDRWSAAAILAFAAAATATAHRVHVPACLDSPPLHDYLARRFPELQYASAVIEPDMETRHVWLDPASCSWTEITLRDGMNSAMRGSGPRMLLYDELISAADAWRRHNSYGQTADNLGSDDST